MSAEMPSDIDPEFTPKIHRNLSPSDLKNHDSVQEGHTFSWNPSIAKSSPFRLHFGGILDLFGHHFLIFYMIFEGSRTGAEKHRKNLQKVLQRLPRRSQSGPKIHQKSLKVGPCSQMAPQGPQRMPLGPLGPPKWSSGTSKVTIWDLKSDHFTLISNHFVYQNSKKGRSFPLLFIDFANSFGRQSTSQMRDEALYWDISHPTSDGQCTLYDGGSKIRGASIFRNMTSYFLIPFLFFVCSFCFAAVQKTQLSSQLSPYGQ